MRWLELDVRNNCNFPVAYSTWCRLHLNPVHFVNITGRFGPCYNTNSGGERLPPLVDQKKKLDAVCIMCGHLDEDGGHLFFKCKNVRKVWMDLQLEHIRAQLASAGSAKQVLEGILHLQEDVQCRVVTLLYLWWSDSQRGAVSVKERRLRAACRWYSVSAPIRKSFQR